MSHFLLRQAAKLIAGSAAPQVASQIAQRLTAPSTRDEDRRRFLIWLAGPFKQSQPEAYERLWPRLHGQDNHINALTGVFLELQSAGPSGMNQWFAQLADSDQQHFDELIEELSPNQPDPQRMIRQASKEAESTFRGAARFLGRTYRKTSQSHQNRRKRKS